MKHNHPILLLLLALLFAACQKEEDYTEVDLGYDYFPNLTGTYIDYRVDSIHYGTTVDTTVYFLRELITESLADGEGQFATRVERYRRMSLQDEFTLMNVWTQKRTTTTAERNEGNQRYIRLTFPVRAGESWNGNAYNTEDPRNHTYGEIDQPYAIGPLQFEQSVRVDQGSISNLIEQREAWEVYARGYGLIHKYSKELEYQNFEITGVEMTYTAIGYGSEL